MSLANLVSRITGVVCLPDRLPHPRGAVTLDLAGYSQVDDFSCGPVAGWIVVRSFDARRSFRKFQSSCATRRDRGTSTPKLARTLREHGLGVVLLRHKISFARLRHALDAGFPVICCVDHDMRDAEQHWLVVYGYQQRPARVFVAGNGWLHLLGSSLFGEHMLSRRRFEQMRVTGAMVCHGRTKSGATLGLAEFR